MATGSPPLLVVGESAQPATNYGGADSGPERYFMYARAFSITNLSRNSSITSLSSLSAADGDGDYEYVATSTTVLNTIDLPPAGDQQFRNSSSNYGGSKAGLWKGHPSTDSLMYSQSSSNTGSVNKTDSNAKHKKRSAGGNKRPPRNRRSMMDLIEDIKEESFDVGSARSDDGSFLGLTHIKTTPRSGSDRKVDLPKRSCDRLGRGRNSRRKLHQRRRRSDRSDRCIGIPRQISTGRSNTYSKRDEGQYGRDGQQDYRDGYGQFTCTRNDDGKDLLVDLLVLAQHLMACSCNAVDAMRSTCYPGSARAGSQANDRGGRKKSIPDNSMETETSLVN